MAQKRTQYVKTADGLEKQLISSAADIVEIDAISGMVAVLLSFSLFANSIPPYITDKNAVRINKLSSPHYEAFTYSTETLLNTPPKSHCGRQ